MPKIDLDRKDNNLGYVKDNLCICCYLCNRTKSNFFTYDEMMVIGINIRKLMKKRHRDGILGSYRLPQRVK